MLKTLSVILALIALVINLTLFLFHYSYWQNSVRKSELTCRIDGICLTAHGPHIYELLSQAYASVGFFLLIFLACRFIRSEKISHLACLSLIGAITLQYSRLHGWYTFITEQFADYETSETFALLRQSVPSIRLSFFIVAALLSAQIASALKTLANSRRRFLK